MRRSVAMTNLSRLPVLDRAISERTWSRPTTVPVENAPVLTPKDGPPAYTAIEMLRDLSQGVQNLVNVMMILEQEEDNVWTDGTFMEYGWKNRWNLDFEFADWMLFFFYFCALCTLILTSSAPSESSDQEF